MQTIRYLTKITEEKLASKMVFLTGPRQCGKTTLRMHGFSLKEISDHQLGSLEDLFLYGAINALREDLAVAHQTVARWIDIFERLYANFRVYPFGAPSVRAVKKEAKHYHYDWTLIENVGAHIFQTHPIGRFFDRTFQYSLSYVWTRIGL